MSDKFLKPQSKQDQPLLRKLPVVQDRGAFYKADGQLFSHNGMVPQLRDGLYTLHQDFYVRDGNIEVVNHRLQFNNQRF